MLEGSLPETGEINVPDIDKNIFQIILRLEMSCNNLLIYHALLQYTTRDYVSFI
jgi:hypothetical protein